MITAKKLFDKMLQDNYECTSTEMMIAFAKLHVKEALRVASINATTEFVTIPYEHDIIDTDSITKSYPLSNIV